MELVQQLHVAEAQADAFDLGQDLGRPRPRGRFGAIQFQPIRAHQLHRLMNGTGG